jgi:hypothetical protein
MTSDWCFSRLYFLSRNSRVTKVTESLTLVAHDHVPDAVFEEVRPHFNDEELVNLTLVVGAKQSRILALEALVEGFDSGEVGVSLMFCEVVGKTEVDVFLRDIVSVN